MVTVELLCPAVFFLQFENACTFKLNIKNISCFLIGLSMVDVSLSWVFCFPYIGICGITVVVGWNRKSIQITLITPILKSLRRPSLPTISHQSIRMSSSPLPPEPYDLHAITSGPTDTWLQNMYRFKARPKNSRTPHMFELYSHKWCISVQCNEEAGRPLFIIKTRVFYWKIYHS